MLHVDSSLERFRVLRSPVFLVSLALLLANDLSFKDAYPGWFTGKLSDFSGLVVFSLFLYPLFRVEAAKVAAGVAVFFVWWKSPYSSFAIELVNSIGPITIGRVVDYSDLFALVVLPFSAAVYENRFTHLVDGELWKRLSLIPIAAVTVFAITGTSRLVAVRSAEVKAAEGVSVLSEEEVDVIVESLLSSRKDECGNRANSKRSCVIDNVWFTYEVDGSAVKFEFEYAPSERSSARVGRVIESIKAAFAEHTEGFTYVEPLIDPTTLIR